MSAWRLTELGDLRLDNVVRVAGVLIRVRVLTIKADVTEVRGNTVPYLCGPHERPATDQLESEYEHLRNSLAGVGYAWKSARERAANDAPLVGFTLPTRTQVPMFAGSRLDATVEDLRAFASWAESERHDAERRLALLPYGGSFAGHLVEMIDALAAAESRATTFVRMRHPR